MATNNPRHGYELSAASLKPRRWAKSTGRNAVARLANLWIKESREVQVGLSGKERQIAMPT